MSSQLENSYAKLGIVIKNLTISSLVTRQVYKDYQISTGHSVEVL